MTEVTIKVLAELINRSGRQLTVGFVTDDDRMNRVLNASKKQPYTITKTFALSTNKGQMKKEFLKDIQSTINGAQNAIKDNSMVGTTLTVTI